MSRLVWLLASTVAVTACSCSKSAANQDTGPTTGGATVGSKLGAPGSDPGKNPDSIQFKDGSGAAPITADRNTLKPNEGKLQIDTCPGDAKAGAECTAKLTLTPGSGFHVNTEYPIQLTLTPPDGVKLAKADFSAGGSDKSKGDADQLDEKALVMSVKMTPGSPGSYTVNGTFKFAVCADDQCLAKKQQVAIAVAVK